MPPSSGRGIAVSTTFVLTALCGCTNTTTTEPASAEAEERSCFLPAQINGFTPVDDDTVDVRVGASRVYRLELTGVCRDVDWAQAIAIRPSGGASWVCRGLDAEVIVPDMRGAQRCMVTDVRRLGEEEARTRPDRN